MRGVDLSRTAMPVGELSVVLLKKLFCMLGLLIIYRIPALILPVRVLRIQGSALPLASPFFKYNNIYLLYPMTLIRGAYENKKC